MKHKLWDQNYRGNVSLIETTANVEGQSYAVLLNEPVAIQSAPIPPSAWNSNAAYLDPYQTIFMTTSRHSYIDLDDDGAISGTDEAAPEAGFTLGNTQSAITPVYLSGGMTEATNLSYDLRENYGIFCSIVTYPVVPKDVIMLRLIPTATHTDNDVTTTISAFKEVKEKLFSGQYISDKIAQF